MRKVSFVLTTIILAMILVIGLTWAKGTKFCQKSTTASAVGCEKKCAAEKACAKASGMTMVDAKGPGAGTEGCVGTKGCQGSEGCQGSGGCHAMKASMPGRGMMNMHPGMMGHGEWAGRDHRRAMKPGSGRLGGADHFAKMAEQLELTDQQVEDLKALKWSQEKSTIEMRAKIEVAHVELEQLIEQKDIDFGKIKAKVSQIADMHKEMQLARWSNIEKSHKLLTAEQLEKAKAPGKKNKGMMKKGPRQMIKEIIIEETEQ